MTDPEADRGYENLSQTIVNLHELFARHEVPHAFGGAIALAFYTEPRGTADIDLNVFLAKDQGPEVLRILNDKMTAEEVENHLKHINEFYGANVPFDRTTVDLFFSFADLHDKVAERVREVEYKNSTIPIVSAEDLVIFKVLYSGNPERLDRDWPDIAGILKHQAGKLDHDYIQEWLDHFLEPSDPRLDRLKELRVTDSSAES